jgi:hypothetical protein
VADLELAPEQKPYVPSARPQNPMDVAGGSQESEAYGGDPAQFAKKPRISTAEEAARLDPGTSFIGPDDKEHVVPYKVDHPEQMNNVPDGADFVGPDGKLRKKPKYEGVDFTAQTLYDIAHSDKGRKMALEKFYPGKVREDPSGGFYVEDEGGKFRKPGRGFSSVGGFVASEAIPVVLSGAGSLLGGAGGAVGGTFVAPGPGTVAGTVAGGAAGGAIGGYAGSKINDVFSQLAGVYDPEGAESAALWSGAAGAAGDIGGRAISAAVPAIKEGVQGLTRGEAKTANKFLGTNPAKLETALPIAETGEVPGAGPLGLSKSGTAVSPSAIFESSPHLTNVAEILQQKFDKSDTYLANAERFMDKRAKEVLASKDIGSIVEDSLVHPKAAVSTEEAGAKIQQSARLRAIGESAKADKELETVLANRRALVENKHFDVFPIAETPERAESRKAMGFPSVVRVDAAGFRDAFEQQGEKLAWSPGRSAQIDERIATDTVHNDYPRVASRGNRIGVDDGRHRIAAAAERGQSIDIAVSSPEEATTMSKRFPPKKASNIEGVRAQRESIVQTAEKAKAAADNLVQQGFRDIEKQANDAVTVAKVGHNAGDLWRTVADSFVQARKAIGVRASKMYGDAETASGGLVPPGANGLADPARQLIAELPDNFESFHPSIVRKLRDIGGVVDEKGEMVREPADATWVQLHNLRSQIRQDIKWNDLPSDIRNGTLKFLDKRISEVLHDVENQPELREASRLLGLADNFYRENMGPLNDQQIKSLVKALDSGLQADPKALLKIAIRDGKTEVANTIRDTVGPQTWDAMRAADVQDMLASSKLLDGSIDGMKFSKQVEDRFQNGVLTTLHGEAGGARLIQQAKYIQQLKGKLPIQPRPGDTANDIILRARSAAADAENLAKTDPLKAMANEMRKVEAAAKKEFAATRKPDPLAFLTNSTVGANEAVNRILKDPDLIVAASRAFPGGEKSPEFQLMRQIWTQRFLSETLDPSEKLAAVSPEIQALMFPGVTLDDMHMLAKEMKLLMGGHTMRGADFAGGMMGQSAVENPFGRISGLGKLAGPTKVLPGANFGARAALTAYYNGIRGLLTSPSTLRWLRKGLMSRDPQAKEAARAELRATLQRGGAMGASAGEAIEQRPTQ